MVIFDMDTKQITSWETFHLYFKNTFGFPDYYGSNMNAWIDCMTYIDDPDECKPINKVEPGDIILINVQGSSKFKSNYPELYSALLECAAFVNMRRLEDEDATLISVAAN